MAETEETAAMLLDDLAALDLPQRREVAKALRKVAETFAALPDGQAASRVLGVLAHLLDPARPRYRWRIGRGDR